MALVLVVLATAVVVVLASAVSHRHLEVHHRLGAHRPLRNHRLHMQPAQPSQTQSETPTSHRTQHQYQQELALPPLLALGSLDRPETRASVQQPPMVLLETVQPTSNLANKPRYRQQ